MPFVPGDDRLDDSAQEAMPSPVAPQVRRHAGTDGPLPEVQRRSGLRQRADPSLQASRAASTNRLDRGCSISGRERRLDPVLAVAETRQARWIRRRFPRH